MIFKVDVIRRENNIYQNKKWLGEKHISLMQVSGIKNIYKWKNIHNALLFLQDSI